ncbi:hypothetical protein FRC11_011827 [Ceratobasidium sp. 423]|nr:hypothetical protein FRC11_011827 [Ceratobasidium sp. 423]
MAPVAIGTTPIPELFRVPTTATDSVPELAVTTKRPAYEHPNRKLEDVKLHSNLGPMNPECLGWLQPTDPKTTSMDEMRERFIEDGYIWVKGLIPREDILAFGHQYFESMAPTGATKEGTNPVDGTYCGADPENYMPPGNGREGQNLEKAEEARLKLYQVVRMTLTNIPVYSTQHREAHYSERLEKITTHPAMFNFIKEFTNRPSVKLLKRQMLRAVHYDHIFLRYGPPTFLTGWLSFGDIKVEGGGLAYLEHAVPLAQAIEDDFSKRAAHFIIEERLSGFNANMARGGALSHASQEFSRAHGDRKWLIADYEAGDIVFRCTCVGVSNRASALMRSSADPDERFRSRGRTLGPVTDSGFIMGGSPCRAR